MQMPRWGRQGPTKNGKFSFGLVEILLVDERCFFCFLVDFFGLFLWGGLFLALVGFGW